MQVESLVSTLAANGTVTVRGASDRKVTGLAYDSRCVAPGDLFAALPGTRDDGLRHAAEAVERGASVILAPEPGGMTLQVPEGVTVVCVKDVRRALGLVSSAFHGDPSGTMKVIGITGTNGKTTLTYLVEEMLIKAGIPCGVIGTIGYRLGGESRPAHHTTPQAPDLQALLRWMADGGASAVAMEVSSHALEQHRIDGTRFAFAVFTNLSQDHLDYHGDFEAYYQAKRRLFTDFAPGASVINLDDQWGRRLAGECPGETITYGEHPDSIIRIAGSTLGRDGVRVSLELPGGRLELTSPLVAAHNVQNIVAAAALGWVMGLPLGAVADGIGRMRLVPGRMEKVSREGEPLVLVDYAHTPDALEKLVAGARPLATGRLILVFGCGGDRDRTKRPLMGAIAARGADLTFVTSDNPRSEEPEAIIEAIVEGYRSVRPDGYEVIPDRSQAIARAIGMAGPDDVVLVAGKGHETYQILGLNVVDFDDRVEARRALDAISGGNG